MPSSPPSLSAPTTRNPITDKNGQASREFAQWLEGLHKRVGGADGRKIIGDVAYFETTIGQASLASGGSVTLLDANSGEQWKVRDIFLSGAGTNFNAGGDRTLSITDNTSTWSVLTAAVLKSLTATRWGGTGVPFPATAAHFTTASASGTDIVAKYSGGTTDYTAGALTIVLLAERVA
jgi:hypothetical protein